MTDIQRLEQELQNHKDRKNTMSIPLYYEEYVRILTALKHAQAENARREYHAMNKNTGGQTS